MLPLRSIGNMLGMAASYSIAALESGSGSRGEIDISLRQDQSIIIILDVWLNKLCIYIKVECYENINGRFSKLPSLRMQQTHYSTINALKEPED